MLVLREDMQERIGRQVRADTLEGQARRRFALHPQIDRRNLVAEFEHGIGQIELAVEFERPRLNRQRPRSRAGLWHLVDNADLYSKPRQPERQDQSSGTGANDQDITLLHFVLHPSVSSGMASAGRAAPCGRADRRAPASPADWRPPRRRSREIASP